MKTEGNLGVLGLLAPQRQNEWEKGRVVCLRVFDARVRPAAAYAKAHESKIPHLGPALPSLRRARSHT
jgi:hypothetical protein